MWKVNAWFFILVVVFISFLFVGWYARKITEAAAILAVDLDKCKKGEKG